jgi:hypothetical protein
VRHGLPDNFERNTLALGAFTISAIVLFKSLMKNILLGIRELDKSGAE